MNHRRTAHITTAALTLPLVLATAVPASAAPKNVHVDTTAITSVSTYVWEVNDQLPGNVHLVYVQAGHYGDGSDETVFVQSYQCDPGESPEADTEEGWCETEQSLYSRDSQLTWWIAEDGTAATISGTTVLAPAEGEPGSPRTVQVDLTFSTPTVDETSTNPYRYRDERGRLVKGTSTTTHLSGTTSGTVASLDLDGASANTMMSTDTYRILGKGKKR
ncbi:hypothetical protein ACQBAT_06400 [Ornithinimicrobium sp. Y1847]|uniref:hypothetical protein n=1 Tax=Ornithinimicrobium sp. Y1847 TaxID=3405419 RepID=UPI003B674603